MKSIFASTLFFAALLSSQNCTENKPKSSPNTTPENPPAPAIAPMALPADFNTYWFAGVAEICTYDVVQDRYGELRESEQVNVFVTEDFSAAKQVKLDDAGLAGSDRVPILKLNAIRRFHTGIYDYSLMQSIFTPLSGAATLKTTTTIQDWCGHVFMQTNLGPTGYRLRGFSYFETEGDQDIQVPKAMLEDELWTRIRLNPETILVGKMDVIPAAFYSRLRHKPVTPASAEIQIEKGAKESVLKLTYANISRSLHIQFETAFPHKILAWEERNEGQLASEGKLKSTRRSAYWGEHENRHAPLRDSLKLRY